MSNPEAYHLNNFDVYEHKKSGERIAYPSRTYLPSDLRSEMRFKRRVKAAITEIKFNKFLTLTYNNRSLKERENNDIRAFFNKWNTTLRKRNLPRVSYIWKLEYGSKNQRPHYHVLCKANYTTNAWLRKTWSNGFVRINSIKNISQAKRYVSKYVSKTRPEIQISSNRNIRRWGTSINIPKAPQSEYKYIGTFSKEKIPMTVAGHNEFL